MVYHNNVDIQAVIQDLSNPAPEVQERAVDTLAKLGCRVVPALRQLIPRKMCNQIMALARMGYPVNAEAIPDLVQELKYSGSFPPKEDLISNTLRSIGGPVLEPLREVLVEHPENEAWISEIAWILLAFDRPQIENLTKDLIRVLEIGLTRDLWSYIGVMELLGRIGSPKANAAIPILCNYYQATWAGQTHPKPRELFP